MAEITTGGAEVPGVLWRGPVPGAGGTRGRVRLFVIHIMQGAELGGCDSWFHNLAARVSAHFGVGRDGAADQWVQLADVAWACGEYNEVSVSIEHAGFSGQRLTRAQLNRSLEIIQHLHKKYPDVPLVWTSNPAGTGVIAHGSLGVAGGNHPSCPGKAVERQYNRALHRLSRPRRFTVMRSYRRTM